MKQSKVSTTYNKFEVKGRKRWRVFMLLKPVYSPPNKQLNTWCKTAWKTNTHRLNGCEPRSEGIFLSPKFNNSISSNLNKNVGKINIKATDQN